MRHYYVLNRDSRATEVFEFIRDHQLRVEVHLVRTRFWVPEGSVLTEFLLRFGDCVEQVDPTVDLVAGLPLDAWL